MTQSDGPGGSAGPAGDIYRLLVETVEDYAIFATDPAGRVMSWNAGAERNLGYAEAEILGRPAAILYTPEDRDRGIPERELEVARDEGRAQDDRWHVRKDRSRFWASGVVVPLYDGAGAHIGFGKVMRDLTERKRLEEDLAASEARFRNIAEQTPVLIWRSTSDGGYDYFNRPWYDFRGTGPEKELASDFAWIEGMHPDDRTGYLARYRAAFERREAFEHTFRLRRHDGLYRWVLDRGAPYFDVDGDFLGYLGSCLDITERVELEGALEQQRELAEEASRHKARLLSALSHDARTPLNAVVLSAHLLELSLEGHPDPEVGESLRTIRHAVRNVLDLLGDLLNLARIDAGTVHAEPTRFALMPALEECLSGIEPQAREKGLALRLDPDGLGDAVLEADRAKLKQILSNLLSNALRYTERGAIRVFVERDAEEVRIGVEDTGVGIAPGDQDRVFEEFARLDNPHRPVGEGTGLGLAICRRLASLLGGEITVRSEPGRGSTFRLALPVSILASAPPESKPGAAEGAGTGPSPTDLVLLAEDHLASRLTLAKILRRMGFRVAEAANGQDALAKAVAERPTVIFMDVNMPVMDGIEATKALRAQAATRDAPIFALTGDVSMINRQRMGEAGVDGFLEKPVSWEAVEEAIAKVRVRPRRQG